MSKIMTVNDIAEKMAKEYHKKDWDCYTKPQQSDYILDFISYAQIAFDFAKEYHSAKMQEVWEDVEDEINSMYPIEQELGNNHIVEMQNLRNAAKFGYNLHKISDWSDEDMREAWSFGFEQSNGTPKSFEDWLNKMKFTQQKSKTNEEIK